MFGTDFHSRCMCLKEWSLLLLYLVGFLVPGEATVQYVSSSNFCLLVPLDNFLSFMHRRQLSTEQNREPFTCLTNQLNQFHHEIGANTTLAACDLHCTKAPYCWEMNQINPPAGHSSSTLWSHPTHLCLSVCLSFVRSIGGAVLINPWNTTELTKQMINAVNMDADEREIRWTTDMPDPNLKLLLLLLLLCWLE